MFVVKNIFCILDIFFDIARIIRALAFSDESSK